MYVLAMKVACTIGLAMVGITPAWCDSCGTMHHAEDLAWCENFAGDGESGGICPGCVDFWTE